MKGVKKIAYAVAAVAVTLSQVIPVTAQAQSWRAGRSVQVLTDGRRVIAIGSRQYSFNPQTGRFSVMQGPMNAPVQQGPMNAPVQQGPMNTPVQQGPMNDQGPMN